jgi:hypothetical protein
VHLETGCAQNWEHIFTGSAPDHCVVILSINKCFTPYAMAFQIGTATVSCTEHPSSSFKITGQFKTVNLNMHNTLFIISTSKISFP